MTCADKVFGTRNLLTQRIVQLPPPMHIRRRRGDHAEPAWQRRRPWHSRQIGRHQITVFAPMDRETQFGQHRLHIDSAFVYLEIHLPVQLRQSACDQLPVNVTLETVQQQKAALIRPDQSAKTAHHDPVP
jgi:hypothetical protein